MPKISESERALMPRRFEFILQNGSDEVLSALSRLLKSYAFGIGASQVSASGKPLRRRLKLVKGGAA